MKANDTVTDETLEPELKAFCSTALKLAKHGLMHSEMTTDTGLVLAIDISIVGTEGTNT
jgi:hypothetical protein